MARERFSRESLSQELNRIQKRLDTVELLSPDIVMNLLLSYRDIQVRLNTVANHEVCVCDDLVLINWFVFFVKIFVASACITPDFVSDFACTGSCFRYKTNIRALGVSQYPLLSSS